MSSWTHVLKTYKIATGIQSQKMLTQVKKKLESAPRITGSEGDVTYSVVKIEGHDYMTSFRGHWREYQTQCIIVLYGDLRDRFIEDTTAELNEFENWLNSEFSILKSYGGVS